MRIEIHQHKRLWSRQRSQHEFLVQEVHEHLLQPESA